jgi:hypothetical protein
VVPQEGVLVEASLEADNLVAGALDRARQQENNLDNFLVTGNPGIEWLSFLFCEVFLVPVLDLLGALEHCRGCLVNGSLDVGQAGLQGGDITVEENLHFEEGLEAAILLGAGAAAANALLHLVEGEFGGVEEGLVHRPVIVLGQADDVFHGDGVDSRVELVRADGLEEILDSPFNLVVLGAQLLGSILNPLLLHLDEFLKSKGGAFLGQVDQHGL